MGSMGLLTWPGGTWHGGVAAGGMEDCAGMWVVWARIRACRKDRRGPYLTAAPADP